MSSNRDKITFYPSDEVARWYEGLPSRKRGDAINEILLAAIRKKQAPHHEVHIEERIENVETELQELAERYRELPGLQFFQKFDASDIEETVHLLREHADDIESCADALDSLNEFQTRLDQSENRLIKIERTLQELMKRLLK